MVDIYNGYQFSTPIVGESNYFDTIKKCYNDPSSFKKGQSAFIDVDLIKEPNNPHDSLAVMVKSQYGVIGYLPRPVAKKYHKDYDKDILSVRAKIFSRDGYIFGVWVDLDYDYEQPQNQNTKKINKKWKEQNIIEKFTTIIRWIIKSFIGLLIISFVIGLFITILKS